MKCPTCRKRLLPSDENCPHCGARATALEPAGERGLLPQRPTRPALGAFLSLIVPGLGQFYVGQPAKGLLFIVLDASGFVTGFLSSIVLRLYAAAEAHRIGRLRDAGDPVSAWGTYWDPTWRPFR